MEIEHSFEKTTSFADLLRIYRTDSLSRNKLAKHAGIDPSYLTRIENGDREPPKLQVVEALARTLRLSGIDALEFTISAGHAPSQLQDLPRSRIRAICKLIELFSNPLIITEDKNRVEKIIRASAGLVHEV